MSPNYFNKYQKIFNNNKAKAEIASTENFNIKALLNRKHISATFNNSIVLRQHSSVTRKLEKRKISHRRPLRPILLIESLSLVSSKG